MTSSVLPIRPFGVAVAALLMLSACGSNESSADANVDAAVDEIGAAETSQVAPDAADSSSGIDLVAFFDGALTQDAVVADCTLADGTETSCYQLTVAGFPSIRDAIGPWCPETTSDDASDAGIWFDGNDVYDISGQFILDLAEIYGDDTWRLYDEDGYVLSTDTSEKFSDLVTGGAQADADAGPVNLCVYGEIEWADGGGAIPATLEIPVAPVLADTPTTANTKIGVTLDGVVIEGSAPVDLILGNYTIGAFDPCGGHVNPQEGYHMHATTGCSDADADVLEGETAMFGYALDGFAIHGPFTESAEADAGLDECNGHETEEVGYHYHANQVEDNAVLTCFSGQTTEAASGTGTGGPPGGGGRPEGGTTPDGAGTTPAE